jgi:hypothetical protein
MLNLKRITAEIRTAEPLSSGGRPEREGLARIFLSDLSAMGVSAYCSQSFAAGQEVALVIEFSTMIYLRGIVVYSSEKDSPTQIISNTPFNYRIGIQFVFDDAAERAAVSKYCNDLKKKIENPEAA